MTEFQTTAIAEDRVRAIAYSLWLEEGQPEGRAESHWLKALELVSEVETPAAAKPAKRKAPAAAATKASPRKRS